ncbi:dihydropteroate synthetase [Plasmodium reichenowi]|uniref:Dihydropteroate synthetase n=1 Tax=Plasmodium reichenowi TaxID=5854 RepID=A0A2P9DBL6_PLARE|nr:dihydropteroate synthetase [Plasmodium reichenowi]
METIQELILSEENKTNIAVLNLGTNNRKNAVLILETALHLVEKYLGKIINTSYLYETVPEYIVLDKKESCEKINNDCRIYDVNYINELMQNLEESKYEENKELIDKCEEYERFLKNGKVHNSILKEVNVENYLLECNNIIVKNDEIMKNNLSKYKDKYYTSYFYNLTVVIKTFVNDPLSMLVIIKYIEELMKRENVKEKEKFENRIIDIDILFFNDFTIFMKNVKLEKNMIYKILSKYIHFERDIKNGNDNISKVNMNKDINPNNNNNNNNKNKNNSDIDCDCDCVDQMMNNHVNNKNYINSFRDPLEIINNMVDKIEFLSIPHVYTTHRYSILLCLNDMIPEYKHNVLNDTIRCLYNHYVSRMKEEYNINIKENNKRIYVLKDAISYLKEKTHIVGILNVNYDSFSDGGIFVEPKRAVQRMFEMINEGASVIDIGGESSAPFVIPNPKISERDLVVPVLQLFQKEWNDIKDKIVKCDAKPIISIDTINYNVFKECVDNDLVDILNDISACTNNPEIIKLLKKKNKFYSVVLMHKRGNPHTMDKLTNYDNLVYDIKNYLEQRLNFLVLNGIPRYRILFDIGLGFAKKHDQSIKLLQNIHVYDDYPLFIGYSRKRFIAHCMNDQNVLINTQQKLHDEQQNENKNILDKSHNWMFQMNYMRKDKDQLLYQKNICGGLAIASYSYYKKVDLIRVHDVLETKSVLDVLTKIDQV